MHLTHQPPVSENDIFLQWIKEKHRDNVELATEIVGKCRAEFARVEGLTEGRRAAIYQRHRELALNRQNKALRQHATIHCNS